MTTKTMDWLNQNRFRAFPYVNDMGLAYCETRIPDCVLLDCLVVDNRQWIEHPEMEFTQYVVDSEKVRISFSYDGTPMSCEIANPGTPAEDPGNDMGFVKMHGSSISGHDMDAVDIRLTFSTYRYIIDHVGEGTWNFHGRIMPTKVVSVASSGVSGIKSNGSKNVNPSPRTVNGTIHLEDGYRTQPVISNGKVLVKVGTMYGLDPCLYPHEEESTPCDDLMFFFCGQNAINSGNVVLQGGPGVSVTQGRTYTAREDIMDTYGKIGIAAGETVPCIEVSAASELLRIYRPPKPEESSSASFSSSSISGTASSSKESSTSLSSSVSPETSSSSKESSSEDMSSSNQ